MAKDLIDEFESLAGNTQSLTSFKATLAAIMHEFGGPAGFARDFKMDFDAAPVGSPHRLRTGTAILTALHNFNGDDGDDSEISTEEKERLLRKLLKEASSDDGDEHDGDGI